jgi:hypothetical protein
MLNAALDARCDAISRRRRVHDAYPPRAPAASRLSPCIATAITKSRAFTSLKDSSVCVVSFGQLEILCHDMKALQHHIQRMMSGEMARESGLMMLLSTVTAEQPVVAFVTNIATRMKTPRLFRHGI